MPGPRFGSVSAWMLIDGFVMNAGAPQDLTPGTEVMVEPADGLGDGWTEKSPTGMSAATLEQGGGFFDTTPGSSYDALAHGLPTDAGATPRVACLGVEGQVLGAQFTGYEGMFQGKFTPLSSVGKLVRANAAYEITGAREIGAIVHPLGVETAAGNSEAASVNFVASYWNRAIDIVSSSVANPSIVTTLGPHGLTSGESVLISGGHTSTPSISGIQVATVISPTTFSVPVNVTVGGAGGTATKANNRTGAAIYTEVTALALGGYTNAALQPRMSTDNVTFVDLGSPILFTAIGAQRIVIAAGTTIRRYLAQANAWTGAGAAQSITYFMGIART